MSQSWVTLPSWTLLLRTPACPQVLKLQSTSASSSSPPVNHASGIKGMILAILQQANYSQHLQLGAVAGIGLQLAQDGIEQEGLMLDAFSNLLTDARGSVARVQARLGNARAPSVVPASLAFHMCMQTVSLPI